MLWRWRTRPAAADRGASAIEYAAVLLVGAVIVGGLLTTGVTTMVVGSVQRALCGVFESNCGGGGGGGTGTAAGDDRGTGQGARGNSPGNGAAPSGGGFGRSRPLAFVNTVGSWLLPSTPAANPGRDNGDEARDIWNDEDRDWDERIEEINDLLTSDSGAEYNGEFFAALGSGNTMEIFSDAFYEFDENGDGVLDEREMARARDELGPLGVRLGDAIRQGTLPPEFRNQLLNGDPRALAMLIDLYPRSFPPEFISAAAENILEDPMDPRLGGDVDVNYEVQIHAVHALGQNPVAAQHFLGGEGNVDLLSTYSGDERKPGYVTAVLEAGLRFNRGGAGHQQAMASIVASGDDGRFWYMSGDQYADAREVLAENLEPYLPWMSRVGQRDVALNPGSTNPPGPPLPTSGDNMVEFLGGLMGESDSRQIVHDMVEEYIGQQSLAAEFADRIPEIEAGDVDGYMDQQEEALDTADVVGGLARVVVQGQHAAHMTEQERIDANLALYDTISGGLTMALSEGAGAAASPAAAVPASIGTELVLNDLFARGRRMLEERMPNNMPNGGDAAATIVNTIANPEALERQLAEEGITDPRHREIMAREIRLILQGELEPALERILTDE
jgi:hypothetical protein